ncbi:MAG: SDR family oxidoreductase [Hyphomicrobiales bacterium]|nr:SDR family oxidoreductase [Hyphomicrobiales bacterium]
MRLQGKTAVVTGGAGNIGLAAAQRFLAEGARVLIVDRGEDRVNEALRQLASNDVHGLSADVTDGDDTARYAAEAQRLFGQTDIFFNNAGIAGAVAPITAYPDAEFDRVMAVNVRGVFLGLKHMLPAMRDGGSVICTSSVAGLRGSAGMAAYVASKHAVVGLMRVASVEASARRIRVNTIHPGPVEGDMMGELERGMAPADPKAAHALVLQRMRLGRFIERKEIADLVTFLASDESRMISGATMVIDAAMAGG